MFWLKFAIFLQETFLIFNDFVHHVDVDIEPLISQIFLIADRILIFEIKLAKRLQNILCQNGTERKLLSKRNKSDWITSSKLSISGLPASSRGWTSCEPRSTAERPIRLNSNLQICAKNRRLIYSSLITHIFISSIKPLDQRV